MEIRTRRMYSDWTGENVELLRELTYEYHQQYTIYMVTKPLEYVLATFGYILSIPSHNTYVLNHPFKYPVLHPITLTHFLSHSFWCIPPIGIDCQGESPARSPGNPPPPPSRYPLVPCTLLLRRTA